jgi:hypothetical protein
MLLLSAVLILAFIETPSGQAQPQKPNILVIMGDDIGWFNPSIYHRGIMGYRMPNIDCIPQEGALFTDWYGQPESQGKTGKGTYPDGMVEHDGHVGHPHFRRGRW